MRSLEQATGCSLFIIIFVALLVPLPIINDANEVSTDNKILVHRLQLMKNTPRRQVCLYAIAWWVLVTRKWLLPAVLVGAAVAQVNLVLPVLFRFTHTCALCKQTLTNPMTVQQVYIILTVLFRFDRDTCVCMQQILLNGLCVTFIMEVDGMQKQHRCFECSLTAFVLDILHLYCE